MQSSNTWKTGKKDAGATFFNFRVTWDPASKQVEGVASSPFLGDALFRVLCFEHTIVVATDASHLFPCTSSNEPYLCAEQRTDGVEEP